MNENIEKLYTARECAEMLRVHRDTIIRYLKNGKLKAIKVGRNFKISESNLREFMERGAYNINNN